MARPSKYSKAVAERICSELMEGMSLREICGAEDMVSFPTVCRWLASNDEFRDQYAHAREVQAEILAEEIIDIADDGINDWMERNGKDDAGWVVNGEHVQRSRLRLDARKWVASRLLPKKYGDRQHVEHSAEGVIQFIDLTGRGSSTD